MRRTERDEGMRPRLTTEEERRVKQLERENREIRRANEILRKASAQFAQARSTAAGRDGGVIDDHRSSYGVEPTCRMLPVTPSTYYEHKGRAADAARLPPGVHRDAWFRPEITRVWRENRRDYGAKKV